MLYFDQTEAERVGTIRQQVWTILHFPFHACILLVVEGLARLSVWRKIINIIIPFLDEFNKVNDKWTDSELISHLNETLNTLYEKFDHSEYNVPDPARYFEQIEDDDGSKSNAVANIFALGFNCRFLPANRINTPANGETRCQR